MKVQIVLLAGLIAVCVAAPPPSGDRESKILRYDSDVREDGYDFAYELSNDIERNEKLKVNKEDNSVQFEGDYSYRNTAAKEFVFVQYNMNNTQYRSIFHFGRIGFNSGKKIASAAIASLTGGNFG